MMKSLSQEQAAEQGGGGGVVKRRPLHHQPQQQPQQQSHSPLSHQDSSDSDFLGGDKKRTTALERRMVSFRRLFHQSSSSRLLALPILITLMLVPIVIFHTLPLSSSSSSSSSIPSSSLWPFGLENRRTIATTTMIEPQSLYGRHYRAVEYAAETGGDATRLENFHYSDQATANADNNSSSISSGAAAAAPQEFDLHHITAPRAFPVAAAARKQSSTNVNNSDTTLQQHRPRHRRFVKPMITREQLEALQDSSAYYDAQPDKWETKRCRAQFAWQKSAYMTCNIHHELDMSMLIHNNDIIDSSQHGKEKEVKDNESLRLVANGYYRDVWVVMNDHYDDDTNARHITSSSNSNTTINSNNNKIVLKTLRYEHEFDLRNWDRHRRDAIAMERLSSSPFVLDIYASCGNSGLTEYAPGGSIKNAIFPRRRPKQQQQQQERNKQQQQEVVPKKPSKIERLQMAVQAAMGLQALHSIGMGTEGSFGPAIAHTDISPDQFVRVGDIYKLNDFNRARFIRVDLKQRQTCSFKISQASGLFRSPEEYDKGQLTEKIDIYSLGNLFYLLLTDHWPWDEVGSSTDSERTIKKRIIHGERPTIPDEIANSSHPVDQVLQKAMAMCQKHVPSERATAAQVAALLQETLQQGDPGRLEQWGVGVVK